MFNFLKKNWSGQSLTGRTGSYAEVVEDDGDISGLDDVHVVEDDGDTSGLDDVYLAIQANPTQ